MLEQQALSYKRNTYIAIIATICTFIVIIAFFIAVLIAEYTSKSPNGSGGDRTPPVITPNVAQIVSYKGDGIACRGMVDVTDNVTKPEERVSLGTAGVFTRPVHIQ